MKRHGNCPAAYIGETSRAFGTKTNNHVSTYMNNNPTKLAFARRLLDLSKGEAKNDYLLGLVIDGNKRNTLSQKETPISRHYFVTRIVNTDTAQEREETNQNRQ